MNHPVDFTPFNKPHTPTKEAEEFIYQIYSLLFEAKGINLRTKQTTLETAAVNLYPWKVVCISEAALRHILTTGLADGLRRGHPFKRADRAKRLFDRAEAMKIREFIKYYFENDTVALVMRKENGKHGTNHWSRLIDVPEGRLSTGSFAVRLGPGDLDWVKDTCAEEKIYIV
ncbi:hypothetical protein [Duganella sp. Dugasp56]|uniref:hypothetical protein n=1 Tax=Duganella sp. Dugasp56 TaxID=3243046 RepID=UPI0039AEA47F